MGEFQKNDPLNVKNNIWEQNCDSCIILYFILFFYSKFEYIWAKGSTALCPSSVNTLHFFFYLFSRIRVVCTSRLIRLIYSLIGYFKRNVVLIFIIQINLFQKCTTLASFEVLKAILQVLIYKALYDKSYLESKTTMTSGEWTCLISFATAPLTCSERRGSEKFKMKIYVSSGIRTHTLPVHDRKVAAP